METINNEDDLHLTYQSAVSNRPKTSPFSPGGCPLCLHFKTTSYNYYYYSYNLLYDIVYNIRYLILRIKILYKRLYL